MKQVLVIILATVIVLLNACQTYEHLRSHPPACNSAKYLTFMGHTRQWVIDQNIPERWIFTGTNDPMSATDPTRIVFFLEGNPESVAGIGCN